uniref:mRNA (AH2-519) for gene 519 from functional T-cell line n=1 Tax=Homo sapiens TaxID=9606 RepID=A2NUB3_HUMAN|nr:unnamed protein product [Homo sapiens]
MLLGNPAPASASAW